MNLALDPYKTLQVDAEADPEVIRVAYRRLAVKYHPDGGPDPQRGRRMAELNAAWEVLRDPARRAAYDDARRTQQTDTSSHAATTRDDVGTTAAAAGGVAAAWGHTGAAAGVPRAESSHPLWTPGRSTEGSTYDAVRMGRSMGHGSAGPPPGRPSGSVLNFGRYAGWSLDEIARTDVEYIEWLDRAQIGRQYQAELDQLLRRAGRRVSVVRDEERHGLFRRR